MEREARKGNPAISRRKILAMGITGGLFVGGSAVDGYNNVSINSRIRRRIAYEQALLNSEGKISTQNKTGKREYRHSVNERIQQEGASDVNFAVDIILCSVGTSLLAHAVLLERDQTHIEANLAEKKADQANPGAVKCI